MFNQLILLLNQWQAKDDIEETHKLSLYWRDWMGILHSSFKNLSTQFHAYTWLSEPFNVQHILQYAVGTKTISANSEEWELPSNITEFSSKLPIMYFFFHK